MIQCTNPYILRKHYEAFVIVDSHAVGSPDAVVAEQHHTSIASPAMVNHWRVAESFAFGAFSYLLVKLTSVSNLTVGDYGSWVA